MREPNTQWRRLRGLKGAVALLARESPADTQARTAPGRAAFLGKFPDARARSLHFQVLAQKRWAAYHVSRLMVSEDDGR
jgi:hypothetical protein